jgi:hypothetical protein
MKRERPIATSSTSDDPTTNNQWLLPHSDRMMRWEYEQRAANRDTREMFPDELADKVGRPKEYIYGLVKNAIAKAKASVAKT